MDRPLNLTASITKIFREISQKNNNNSKHKQINKQTEKQKNMIKKHNSSSNNKYTNLHTITSKLFSLEYFTKKILSEYRSGDIYKKDLHLLPLRHHD